MKDGFLTDFRNHVRRQKIFKESDRILVGVSGGSDSIGLLTAILKLQKEFNLSIFVAHVNYNLRGEDSKSDERFVKEYCYTNNLPLFVKSFDLQDQQINENSLRNLRLDYFNSLVHQYKISKIALAHTMEDQAETVLHRFLRGSGLNGLKGIEESRIKIIHPFLAFRKDEIRKYLEDLNLGWVEDKTNKESDFTRNKLRNEFIPWITDKVNPQIIQRLYSYSNYFNEIDRFLWSFVQPKLKKIILNTSSKEIELDIIKLNELDNALKYYVFRYCIITLTGSDKDIYTTHFDNIKKLLLTQGTKQIDLPGDLIVRKEYDNLSFCHKKEQEEVVRQNTKELDLVKTFQLFEKYRITIQKTKVIPDTKIIKFDPNTAYFDLDKISLPIILRHRQNGDRFIPYGMQSEKKLKDFLIDEKINLVERDKLVIFSDKENIIWIGGIRIDQRVAITKDTASVLIIKIEDLQESKNRSAERKIK